MRGKTLQAVRQQYAFCCGYCGVSETAAGSTLTVDHYQPRSQGGSDAFDNLVYCCHACNEHKGDYWNPDGVERVLHPLRDDPAAHFAEQEGGALLPLTETGRFHVARLQLNRLPLVNRRRQDQEERLDRQLRILIVKILNQTGTRTRELESAIDAARSGGE
jgi:hypothetical protein